jgi:hypothetical protein
VRTPVGTTGTCPAAWRSASRRAARAPDRQLYSFAFFHRHMRRALIDAHIRLCQAERCTRCTISGVGPGWRLQTGARRGQLRQRLGLRSAMRSISSKVSASAGGVRARKILYAGCSNFPAWRNRQRRDPGRAAGVDAHRGHPDRIQPRRTKCGSRAAAHGGGFWFRSRAVVALDRDARRATLRTSPREGNALTPAALPSSCFFQARRSIRRPGLLRGPCCAAATLSLRGMAVLVLRDDDLNGYRK